MDETKTADSKVSSNEPTTFDFSEKKGQSYYLKTLVKKLAIETGGIQRVTDEQREAGSTHVWNAATFWFSANFATATLSTGLLGPSFGLDFWSSFACILVTNVVLTICPAFVATFGLTGLRMATFTRYSFGYWGNTVTIVFALITCIGWNAINAIAGASCWAAASDGTLPTWAGVIIISTTCFVVCIGGISWIHHIDTYFWILPLIVWCVAAGLGADHFHGAAVPKPVGENGAASVLSFIAINISWCISWSTLAADYNVRMPVHTPQWKIFVATYVGILVPSLLCLTLGAALYTGAQTNPDWMQAYDDHAVGGLLAQALKPVGGFGKFLLVLAGLSAVPNNIPNQYSFALAAQNFGPWAIKVPRIVFVSIGFVISTIVGCFASLSFELSLTTLLSIIGYWTVILLVVVAEEHYIFRKGRWSSYDWDDWCEPDKLPFGWAGIATICFGWLGALLGMSELWYVAPIAKLIGGGGNIGHEMAFALSAVTFPVFRWLEIRYTGK